MQLTAFGLQKTVDLFKKCPLKVRGNLTPWKSFREVLELSLTVIVDVWIFQWSKSFPHGRNSRKLFLLMFHRGKIIQSMRQEAVLHWILKWPFQYSCSFGHVWYLYESVNVSCWYFITGRVSPVTTCRLQTQGWLVRFPGPPTLYVETLLHRPNPWLLTGGSMSTKGIKRSIDYYYLEKRTKR